ncbi:hypothetical protein CPSG_00389 [Coccidioides posadasii str. Silveira]|uniref:Uncharacterized protein n=2 Tax=Coccidioides posadasii TaxID=199306 RepID=E9CRR3_COCPS|nr:hypothetical protein CPSG_00389 [Coccidioides posadasii str. Silveira]KMM63946.1 hypothetical protein CPAG_00298 [Coccidioides posadasii RMSCC 3488]
MMPQQTSDCCLHFCEPSRYCVCLRSSNFTSTIASLMQCNPIPAHYPASYSSEWAKGGEFIFRIPEIRKAHGRLGMCGVKTPLFYHIIIQAGLIHEWALSTEQQLEYKFLVDSRRNAPEVLRTRLLSKYFKKFEYFTVLVSFVYPYVVRQRHGFDRICRFDAVVLFQTFLKHAAKQQIRTVRFDWLDWQAGCQ